MSKLEPLEHDFDTQAQVEHLTDKVNELVGAINVLIEALKQLRGHQS